MHELLHFNLIFEKKERKKYLLYQKISLLLSRSYSSGYFGILALYVAYVSATIPRPQSTIYTRTSSLQHWNKTSSNPRTLLHMLGGYVFCGADNVRCTLYLRSAWDTQVWGHKLSLAIVTVATIPGNLK
ncbi:uncharacterized protein BDV17DRAFT_276427 [Aspergillus undulatus]|uniref:uncharacterized protein n=1 Tax=Aspergillus undulatus TaxID=1810928 RepID=UPI003CCD0AEB